MKKFIILLLSILHCSFSMAQIGTWKAYMAYSDIQEIQKAGDELFVMASNDLYQYNLNDQSIYTYDKTNGLNDTNIKHIKWCPQAQRLIVVYENSNIDLIETDGDIINISDLYTKVITGDKTVSSIRIDGVYAYLICGFGIVKVNMERAEISDSYTPNHPEYPKDLPAEDNSDYDKYIETVKTLNPGGPKYNRNLSLKHKYNRLYTCPGIIGGHFGPNAPGCLQTWDDIEWTYYQDQLNTITGHSYLDLSSFDIDPNDTSHVFAGGRTGLYEFKNGKFVKEYNYDNSPLKTTAAINGNSKDYTFVQTLIFDSKGHLWLMNSGSDEGSLFEIKENGEWISHHKREFMNSGKRTYDNIVNAMIDSRGLFWFCNDRFIEASLLCYQPTTDEAVAYTNFVNQDGLKIENVYGVTCVAEDLEGNIWVGTDKGLLMIEKDDIGKSPDDMVFTQVKVPRNDGTDYADYLLSGIHITCITIDNDGNKWIGTNGLGVYTISRDNLTEINHFTTENSKLISNIIGSIAIDENNGEVFIGTDEGLCSYMSGITKPIHEMTEDNVYAYPNPVTSDYTGLITITGLTYNADVKILTSSGKLVAEGKSNGRFFKWDGRDKDGNKVASGVYMVATATSDGNKGVVCKIAIIR